MDLIKSQKEFIKYTEKYDLNQPMIELKQKHSIRVMEISKQIATKMELSQEEIELATLIGLLHDIARFEQYTQYHTFRDIDSIDHGDLGAEILNKELRKYIETNKYDGIIKIAVKNHNKYKIEKGLTEKQLLFAKIIRDADKMDIFYESCAMLWNGKENIIENSTITPERIEEFKMKKQFERKKEKEVEHEINEVLSVISFIFDMNFKSSFEILKKEDYINKIINRFNLKDEKTREEVENIRKEANEYIERKIIE